MQYFQFPQNSLDQATILAELEKMKEYDLSWKTGKAMAYVYATAPEAKALAEEAYAKYFTENAIAPSSFPSLIHLERQVTAMVADLLGGGAEAVGNCTSGGSESIMLAVKTARDYACVHKPEIQQPEMIVPQTAHPHFHKAGQYLGVKVISIPVETRSFKVSPKDIEAAINSNTILLVGSAPSYAHGVIDPIETIAAIAKSYNILCHVDSCIGGMYLPFAKKLGYDIPDFDLNVDGVTSISCDLHTFGYVPNGCSTIIYRSKNLRQYQFFSHLNWPGSSMVDTTVLSSKTGGSIAAAWAMFMYYGLEGYKNAVENCQQATQILIEGVREIAELEVLGKPQMSLIAIKSIDPKISIFELADLVKQKGWYLEVQLASQTSAEAIHITISHFNAKHIPELVKVIRESIKELKTQKSASMQMLEGLDSTMISLLLEDFSPDMLDHIEAMLGIEVNHGFPENMALINTILNSLEVSQRSMLLHAFANRMLDTTNPKKR